MANLTTKLPGEQKEPIRELLTTFAWLMMSEEQRKDRARRAIVEDIAGVYADLITAEVEKQLQVGYDILLKGPDLED